MINQRIYVHRGVYSAVFIYTGGFNQKYLSIKGGLISCI